MNVDMLRHLSRMFSERLTCSHCAQHQYGPVAHFTLETLLECAAERAWNINFYHNPHYPKPYPKPWMVTISLRVSGPYIPLPEYDALADNPTEALATALARATGWQDAGEGQQPPGAESDR